MTPIITTNQCNIRVTSSTSPADHQDDFEMNNAGGALTLDYTTYYNYINYTYPTSRPRFEFEHHAVDVHVDSSGTRHGAPAISMASFNSRMDTLENLDSADETLYSASGDVYADLFYSYRGLHAGFDQVQDMGCDDMAMDEEEDDDLQDQEEWMERVIQLEREMDELEYCNSILQREILQYAII